MTTEFRTKYTDPDYRRDPKTDHFCALCQKDMDPDKPYRVVHLVEECGVLALHVDDEAAYVAAGPHADDYGSFPIGNNCAKRLGHDYSHPLKEK